MALKGSLFDSMKNTQLIQRQCKKMKRNDSQQLQINTLNDT